MRASRGLKWENKMYKPKRSIGFMHKVNNFGQRASPCGNPLANKMRSDSSVPCLVLTEILVFHLALSLSIRFPIHCGHLLAPKNNVTSTKSTFRLNFGA